MTINVMDVKNQDNLQAMSDAAEMLWGVVANVDWDMQTPEWRAAAARWRDNYLQVRLRITVQAALKK